MLWKNQNETVVIEKNAEFKMEMKMCLVFFNYNSNQIFCYRNYWNIEIIIIIEIIEIIDDTGENIYTSPQNNVPVPPGP